MHFITMASESYGAKSRMTEITIAYLARINSIPPGTISMNVKALLDNIPGLKELMMKNES